MTKKLPNLFIVGAPKAGTTSLYRYLNQHPEVFMSKIKEPNYFSGIPALGPTIVVKDEKKYKQLFKNVKNEKIVGEASTTYLYFEGTAERIKDFNKEAKIIIMLRNPVERAISHYLMDRDKFLIEHDPPELALKDMNDPRKYGFHGFPKNPYLFPSLYYKPVKKYIEIFGLDQVKIIIFEKFKKDVINSMKEIFTFLEVDKEFVLHDISPKNYYKSPKNKLLIKILKNNLTFYFKNYVPESIKNFLNNSVLYEVKDKPEISLDFKQKLFHNYFLEDVQKLSDLLQTDLFEVWRV